MNTQREIYNSMSERWWQALDETQWEKELARIETYILRKVDKTQASYMDDYSLIQIKNEIASSEKPYNVLFNLDSLPKVIGEGILTVSSGLEIPQLLPLCIFLLLSSLKEAIKIEFSPKEVATICALLINDLNNKSNTLHNISKTANNLAPKYNATKISTHEVNDILEQLKKYKVISVANEEYKIIEKISIESQ